MCHRGAACRACLCRREPRACRAAPAKGPARSVCTRCTHSGAPALSGRRQRATARRGPVCARRGCCGADRGSPALELPRRRGGKSRGARASTAAPAAAPGRQTSWLHTPTCELIRAAPPPTSISAQLLTMRWWMSRFGGRPAASMPRCRCTKLPVRGVAWPSWRYACGTAPVRGEAGDGESGQSGGWVAGERLVGQAQR